VRAGELTRRRRQEARMCNRYRLTAKQAELMATFGIRPPYEPDETFPAGEIFPTGKKTPFYGAVIMKDGDDRRLECTEWGVPTQVPSKRPGGEADQVRD
jgi:putative SOS response-associated peptidase YedK